jgi:hypothetical protein
MESENTVFQEFFDFLKQKAPEHFLGKPVTFGDYFTDESGETSFIQVIGEIVNVVINKGGKVDLIISYNHPFLLKTCRCAYAISWSHTKC